MNTLTGVERHIAAAAAMLRRGVRPTVDLIVAECGGSRSTAQKALAELWENRLPKLLDARDYEDDVPVPIREAVGAVWREAQQQADAVAQAALAEQMRTLDTERAALSGVLAGIEAERQAAADAQAALTASLADRDAELADALAALKAEQAAHAVSSNARRDAEYTASERLALLDAYRDEITALRDRQREDAQRHEQAMQSAAESARVEAERAVATAADERAALVASHAQALDALQAAYNESDMRLRLELDAANTELAKLRKQTAQAAQTAADKLDALRAQLAEAQRRLEATRRPKPWRRSGATTNL